MNNLWSFVQSFNSTPLICASIQNHVDIVDHLLAHQNINPYCKDIFNHVF